MANTWLKKKEVSNFKLGKENCKELLHVNDSLYASVLWHSSGTVNDDNCIFPIDSDGATKFWRKSRKHLISEFLKQLKSLDSFYSYFIDSLPDFVKFDFVSENGDAIVVEDGKEEIWNLPIETKKLLFISDSINESNFDVIILKDILNVLAAEMAFNAIKDIHKDIRMLKENNIASYNYYIHSFSLGKSIVGHKEKSGRHLYVKYAKACILG